MTNLQIVDINDLTTSEDDQFKYVEYNGEPFTGIATGICMYENYYGEYRYKDGFGHGKCFTLYPNGDLYRLFELEKGVEVGENTVWYESGELCSYDDGNTYSRVWDEQGKLLIEFDRVKRVYRKWNRQGILIHEYDWINDEERDWYQTGELQSVRLGKREPDSAGFNYIYYTKSGVWFARTEKDTYRYGYNYEYNPEAYFSFHEVGDDDHLGLFIERYLSYTIDRDRIAGLKLWIKMLEHENIYTKYTAIRYAGENKIKETLPYLRTLLSDDNRLPEKIHRDGGGGTSYLYSIAQEAEMAIEKIEGKK